MGRDIDVLDMLILKLMCIHEMDLFVSLSLEDINIMVENISQGSRLSSQELAMLSARDFYDFSWLDNSLSAFLEIISQTHSLDWSIDALKHVATIISSRCYNLERNYLEINKTPSIHNNNLAEIFLKDFPNLSLL